MATSNEGVAYIPGTSPGAKYLVIARRGKIALGIRPYPVTPGERMHAPGRSYLPIRVHSALDAKGAAEPEDNVLSLGEAQLGLDSAWPEIAFEDVSTARAATTIGLFLRGSLNSDAMTLLERMKQLDLYEKIAQTLTERAGGEHMVMRVGALSEWLQAQYAEPVAKIEAAFKANQELLVSQEGELETVGFQTAALAKLYEKYTAVPELDPKLVASDKGDEGGANEPDPNDDEGDDED